MKKKNCHVLKNGEWCSQKQAAWVITNVTSKGTTDQITYLIETVGVLESYCNLMDSKDAPTMLVTLNDLKNLLQLANNLGYLEKVNFEYYLK